MSKIVGKYIPNPNRAKKILGLGHEGIIYLGKGVRKNSSSNFAFKHFWDKREISYLKISKTRHKLVERTPYAIKKKCLQIVRLAQYLKERNFPVPETYKVILSRGNDNVLNTYIAMTRIENTIKIKEPYDGWIDRERISNLKNKNILIKEMVKDLAFLNSMNFFVMGHPIGSLWLVSVHKNSLNQKIGKRHFVDLSGLLQLKVNENKKAKYCSSNFREFIKHYFYSHKLREFFAKIYLDNLSPNIKKLVKLQDLL